MISSGLDHRDAFAALDEDWKLICRRNRRSDVLQRWAAQEPVFSGMAGLTQVIPPRHQRGNQTPVCDALGRLHAHGDDLAGRALVQLLVPGMVIMAAKWRAKFGAQQASWEVVTRVSLWIAKLRNREPRNYLAAWLLTSVNNELHDEQEQRSITETLLGEDDLALEESIKLASPSAEDEANAGPMVRRALQEAHQQGILPAYALPTVWLMLHGIPATEAAERTWSTSSSASRHRIRFTNYFKRHVAKGSS